MSSTDPLIYRFYELVQTYGTTWKALIEEEFGDGIMSAIDFEMQIEREPNAKGDKGQDRHVREVLTLQTLLGEGSIHLPSEYGNGSSSNSRHLSKQEW
jgi:cyanate lyase